MNKLIRHVGVIVDASGNILESWDIDGPPECLETLMVPRGAVVVHLDDDGAGMLRANQPEKMRYDHASKKLKLKGKL